MISFFKIPNIGFRKTVSNLLVLLLIIILLISIITFEGSSSNQKFSVSTGTRSNAWIEALQKNFDNPQWFYNNLNAQDRLNIRLALDYAIPRQDIIDSLNNGFGYLLATTDTPLTGPTYYNASLVARPYNLTKAKEFLTQVFGYTYENGTDNKSTPYDESLAYFPMNLIVPSSGGPLRIRWPEKIESAYKSIGVYVSITSLTFPQINQRIFNNIVPIGSDFVHGGFDGLFIGWSASLIPDDGSYFYNPSSFPNNGFNYQFVNNSVLNGIMAREDNVTKLLLNEVKHTMICNNSYMIRW